MAITVLNPFDGEPMKVRDNDAGRAVKDKQGRIFYVLPRSDGQGYYGATTRAGNPKEEQRAMELEVKTSAAQGHTHEVVANKAGPKKSGMKGKLILLIIILIAIVGAWAFLLGPLSGRSATTPPPAPDTSQADSPAAQR